MAKKGKRSKQHAELLAEAELPAALEVASDLVKKVATAKFDESIDIDVRLGVDPRHADQMVRGSVSLPHGTGRTVRVLVLTNEGQQQEARDAGAEHVGLDDYVEKIKGGWTDVDVVIATPDVMAQVGQLGRILGPRGLMPNPKTGTVTRDVTEAVHAVRAGKIDFRVDRYGIIHASIGRASFSTEQLTDNARAFLKEIVRLRPSASKGTYVRSITLTPTMGPGVAVDPLGTVMSLR
ncbi:MAG: 50S ribosomal protein L1 [Rhodothermales bacterium]|jgi:large subunit ribosomal protein L1